MAKLRFSFEIAKLFRAFLRLFLLETDGFGRLDARNHVARSHEGEDGDDERADIDSDDGNRVEEDGDGVDIVGGGIEVDEAPVLFGHEQSQGEDIADEQAAQGDEGGKVEEDGANARVAGTQGFEHTDGLCALEDEDEQAAHHREAGHSHHEAEDDNHVDIEQIEPGEDLGIVFLDAEGLTRLGIGGGVHLLAESAQGREGLWDLVDVVEAHFEHRGLRVVPMVEPLDGGDGGEYVVVVEDVHVGAVDTADSEAAGLDALFEEVGEDAVAHLQPQFVGLQARDEDVVAVGVLPARQSALNEARGNEGGVVGGGQPLEGDAFEVGVGLDDAHLLHNAVGVSHIGQMADGGDEGRIRTNGEAIGSSEGAEVQHFDVAAKSFYFLGNFALETGNDADGDNHDGQPDGHTCRGYGDAGVGGARFVGTDVLEETAGNEEREAHGGQKLEKREQKSCPCGRLHGQRRGGRCLTDATRVGIQSLVEHEECALEVFLLEDVGNAHLVSAGTGGGVETGSRGHHDRFALVVEIAQTPSAEAFGIIDGQACHRVESSHRDGTIDTGNAIESLNEAVATLHVLFVHLLHVALRRVDRGFCHNLSEEGRGEAGLAELHHGRVNSLVFSDERTDAYAAFRVALRHRVDEHHVLLNTFEMAGRDVGRVGVDELAVDLIGEEEKVVLLDQIANLVHLLPSVEVARRVVGVADEEGSRVLVDEGFKLLNGGKRKSLFDGGGDGADAGTGGNGKRHVVGVGGLGDDDFITGVQAGEESKQHSLRTTGSDDDVVGSELNVVAVIVVDQLLPITFKPL